MQVSAHALKHQVQIFATLRPHHFVHLDHVAVVYLFEDGHLAVGALGVGAVLEGVEGLLEGEGSSGARLAPRLPHDAIRSRPELPAQSVPAEHFGVDAVVVGHCNGNIIAALRRPSKIDSFRKPPMADKPHNVQAPAPSAPAARSMEDYSHAHPYEYLTRMNEVFSFYNRSNVPDYSVVSKLRLIGRNDGVDAIDKDGGVKSAYIVNDQMSGWAFFHSYTSSL